MQNDRPMFGNAKSLPVKSLPVQNSLYSTVLYMSPGVFLPDHAGGSAALLLLLFC